MICESYILAVLCTMYNIDYWKVDLSFKTMKVILFGVLSFVITWFTSYVTAIYLFSLKFQRFGQLLPFSVVGNLDGIAGTLLEHVDGIVFTAERSSQVFTAKIVNQL